MDATGWAFVLDGFTLDSSETTEMKNGEHPETPHPEKPAAILSTDGVMMYGKIGTGQGMRVVFPPKSKRKNKE